MEEFSNGMTQRNDLIQTTVSRMNERYLKLEGLVNERLGRMEEEWRRHTEAQEEREEEEMESMQQELARKSEVIDLLNEKLDRYTDELKRRSEETEQVRAQLEASRRDSATREADNTTLRTQVTSLEDQLRAAHDQNKLLNTSLTHRDSQISNLQGGIVNLNRELGESCGEIRRLEESVKRLENIVRMNNKPRDQSTRKVSRYLTEYDIVVVHDAVLNHLTNGFLRNEGLNVKKIWGPNLRKTYETVLTMKTLPRCVLIHTGTYDLEKLSEQEILDWVEKIYYSLHYRGVKTIFSTITPRGDNLDAKGQLVNALVATKLGSAEDFIVCRNDNLLGTGGRFNESLYDDDVHVNSELGTRFLEENVRYACADALGVELVNKTKTKNNKKRKQKRNKSQSKQLMDEKL